MVENVNPIFEYNNKISSGEIVVCEKIKGLYSHLVECINDENSGYKYSEKRANHVINFIERFCKHSKGKWARQPVKLELWQKAFFASVFGVVHKVSGKRRFREAVLIIGKKNGKSLMGSTTGLYMFVGDGEGGAECYSAATKREQAKIVWEEAANMVGASPALRKRIKCRVNALIDNKTKSKFKTLSSDSRTEDGLNIHYAGCDEIHAWRGVTGKQLYNIIEDGISAREEPLVMSMTTAGYERDGVYDEKYDKCINIINGYKDKNGIKDDAFLPVVYELDKEDEYLDPKMWVKANPNLGVSKSYEYLTRKVNNAKSDSNLLPNLLTKEFNIKQNSVHSWLTFDEYNNERTFDIVSNPPDYAIPGTDLSSTTDLTSACIFFKYPNIDEEFFYSMYWMPEDLLEKRIKEDNVPYDIWVEKGFLRLCRGNLIDYSDVISWYRELFDELNIMYPFGGYDAWGAKYWAKDMANNFGDVFVPIRQGKQTLSLPMQRMGANLKSKLINYNNNPITKMCLRNTSVDIDKNGNIQPHKTSQYKRIDGVAAMLNAYTLYCDRQDEYMNLL